MTYVIPKEGSEHLLDASYVTGEETNTSWLFTKCQDSAKHVTAILPLSKFHFMDKNQKIRSQMLKDPTSLIPYSQ